MFIDTSVIVALLAREPDAGRFAERIASAPTRYTSGLVILEASMRLSTMLDLDPAFVGMPPHRSSWPMRRRLRLRTRTARYQASRGSCSPGAMATATVRS